MGPWPERWKRLVEGQPGHRFQAFYGRRQKRRKSKSGIHRASTIFAGGLIAMTGLVLVPAPGPGWATVVVGLAVLAGESRFVATALDQAELKGRAAARVGDRMWESASLPIRVVLVLGLGVFSFFLGLGSGAFL